MVEQGTIKAQTVFAEALGALRQGAADLRRSADVLDRLLDQLDREFNDDAECQQ
jgi:hypothetical protein